MELEQLEMKTMNFYTPSLNYLNTDLEPKCKSVKL